MTSINILNYCKDHPERPAENTCSGCGEHFCRECLDENNNCRECSVIAERFLGGFSMALSRWEAGLRNKNTEIKTAPQAVKKKLRLPKLITFILVGLIIAVAVNWLSNYHLNIGQNFLDQGNLPKALYHFQQAVKDEPENAKLYYTLGNIYFQQGILDEAIKSYRSCLDLDSLNAAAMNNLAWTFAQLQENLEEALILSRRSLELDPENPNYLDTAAEIYFLKKEFYKALTYIRKAVNQNPPNIEYYKNKMEKYKQLAYGDKRLIRI